MVNRAGTERAGRKSERVVYRGAVLRLGGMLGLSAAEIIGLAEALAGRSWRRCGTAEFRLVLDEYAGMLALLDGKAHKQARRRDAVAGVGTGGGNASTL